MQNESKATVYITEGRSVDYSPALVYGEIKVLDLGKAVPYTEGLPPNMAFNKDLTHRIRRELADYIPGHDLICPTGAPAIMLAVGVFLGSLPGQHRLLGWDNHTRRYLEYRVEVKNG